MIDIGNNEKVRNGKNAAQSRGEKYERKRIEKNKSGKKKKKIIEKKEKITL